MAVKTHAKLQSLLVLSNLTGLFTCFKYIFPDCRCVVFRILKLEFQNTAALILCVPLMIYKFLALFLWHYRKVVMSGLRVCEPIKKIPCDSQLAAK